MSDAGSVQPAPEPTVVQGTLVPFANPLADEKEDKKIMKAVDKATKHAALKRGVKEVVKSLRKSPAASLASSGLSLANPAAVCILAADISPMDVISHLPVLCEDHNVPYVYVSSRARLGRASATKRPTSVVLVTKDKVRKRKEAEKEGDAEEWAEAYAQLVKVAKKAAKRVTV
ncbi:50S ribosomal protein L30e-like protein [Lineolata rhizophorae]|uniref:H/ACA ribonucleoprotein complex subunit 2 n=1 Tax=Lineolata rhizophorae TaxID=578093 RepID=A0A6A6NLT0_9PEZI|nr:50S ribosomal protein L30e-like protein [Lineolata rhizophorae]